MSQKLRLFYYALGPANMIKPYSHWVKGEDDPSRTTITYTAQFYDVCRALDAEVYVLSSCSEKQLLHDGQFTIEHRPNLELGKNLSGFLYSLGQLWYMLRIIATAVRFRANVAIVGQGTRYRTLYSLLPLFGIQVIWSLHCVLWPKYNPPKGIKLWRFRLTQNFFAKNCAAILTHSDDIIEQIAQLTGESHPPIVQFSPIYCRSQFDEIDEPDAIRSPFRVMFAGQIERFKGVFDLLEIAKRFADEGRQAIIFELCGDGSALESLRLAAKEAGVEPSFVCYGYCQKQQMREVYNRSHVVIVPTRTEFVEGFNKVVIEGVLSGRPVITSAVCPSLPCVTEAVVEVPPDDPNAYGDAVLKLCDDCEFYEEKRRGCLGLQEQFYDISRGWGTKLKSILVAIQESREIGEIRE